MKLQELLKRLVEHQVRFSVIGGVALQAAGRPKDMVDLGFIRALKTTD